MMRKHRVTSLVVACVVLPVFLWLFTTVGIAASQLSVSVWTDKTQYQIGEQVVIKFKVNKACNAKLTILKPNGGVVTWGPKTIPAATVSVKSTAGSPTGQRTVTVEASLGSEYKKAVTTFIVGSGGGPGPSPGPGPGPWQIVAKHSGKCLDVSGAGKNSGDNVHQWDCHNGDHQRWELKPAGGNYYQLVAKHSGKCLDVSGAGKNSGDNVQQWDCHNGACQQWELKPAGGNYYQLVAKHSGKCLDVSGWGHNNGDNVQQWDCHDGDCQRWELRPLQGSGGTVYDFIANAGDADWRAGGAYGEWPAPEVWGTESPYGLARCVYAPHSKMEDGSTPQRCLEMRPTTDSYIRANFYPHEKGYVVHASNRLVGKVGLLYGAYSGNVRFKIRIFAGDQSSEVVRIDDTYDGKLKSFDVPLAQWAGKDISFHFFVNPFGNSSAQNWACWVDARIVR